MKFGHRSNSAALQLGSRKGEQPWGSCVTLCIFLRLLIGCLINNIKQIIIGSAVRDRGIVDLEGTFLEGFPEVCDSFLGEVLAPFFQFQKVLERDYLDYFF